ncbi:MAG TPA: hypothetical protein DCZ63_08570 [Geobacter sp.]|nr:hypothetical protein [Geobacter sp.]
MTKEEQYRDIIIALMIENAQCDEAVGGPLAIVSPADLGPMFDRAVDEINQLRLANKIGPLEPTVFYKGQVLDYFMKQMEQAGRLLHLTRH